ncbi:uncharacterized protein HKW66_Vig0077100 [Vigna angularis]|uniref:Uncharacterized protein n=1 Tax=Phaseolus angularis TaxID=3914 RepID=A0A8T0K9L3_PHAAN|nr:uncharacterized protein HKW66_Vig0077100 [Vigna angularis]
MSDKTSSPPRTPQPVQEHPPIYTSRPTSLPASTRISLGSRAFSWAWPAAKWHQLAMASSGFFVLCLIGIICAFAVPCFGRDIPTDPKTYEDTEKNIPLSLQTDQGHQLLDGEDRVIQPQVKFSENSKIMINDKNVANEDAGKRHCPPEHCPP